MEQDRIIFCDFDGTVTATETLEGFLQQFMGEDIREAGRRMAAAGYSVKRGVTEFFSAIRSEDYLKKTDYFHRLPLREGFGDFLDYAAGAGIPVVILSGGIREMTETVLAPYRDRIAALWAADVDLSGEYVRFYSRYETENEIVGKVGIMSRYDCRERICIGDSYTDMEMAAAGELVFARDRLARALDSAGKKYYGFETFYDIISMLKNL